jgi:hypothetical protein
MPPVAALDVHTALFLHTNTLRMGEGGVGRIGHSFGNVNMTQVAFPLPTPSGVLLIFSERGPH